MIDNFYTAPLALIKVGSTIIGTAKDIRVQETFQRVDIRGIGRLNPQEVPIVGWSGTVSVSFFNIDFRKTGLSGLAAPRTAESVQSFMDSMLLQQAGLTLNMYKKIKKPDVPVTDAGIVTPDFVLYAQVNGLFLDVEGFSVVDGQVSDKNQSFRYIDPIVFTP